MALKHISRLAKAPPTSGSVGGKEGSNAGRRNVRKIAMPATEGRTGAASEAAVNSVKLAPGRRELARTQTKQRQQESISLMAERELLVAPLPPEGQVELVSHDEIVGWAWDPAAPNCPVDIEVLDGNLVLLRIAADQYRPDLQEAGMGNGNHGFAVKGMSGAFPLSRHFVRIRLAKPETDLRGSPVWISQPDVDFRALDFMSEVISTAIQAAATADDLGQVMRQLLALLNDVVNAHEVLGRQQSPDEGAPSPIQLASDFRLTERTKELIGILQSSYAPVSFPLTDEPVVSVIIPVHNKFIYTYNCLRSISSALPERPFEIIIVDDCSSDETIFSGLVFVGAVRVVRNASNLGFIRSCNAGAAAARGHYLFFLNNDTLVKEGWIDELVNTFEQTSNVGIVGSKLLFEDGRLQEVGGIVWRLGDAWNWGRERDPAEPVFSFLRDADYVSGAALMIERALFTEVGGFDEHYVPAYYEDTDLAFRVRAQGKRVVVQPASEIIHLEGISSGTDATSEIGVKRYQKINRRKFYERWKDTLLTHRLNGQQPELEAERLVQRRVYFIDETVPTPDQDAGSNAAFEHMRTLIELGYKVTFIPSDNMAQIRPYTANLQKLGIECLYAPFYWSVEEVFRKTSVAPDLVYLHRFVNASTYAVMVHRYFPKCRIVYNVADLHFLRLERLAALEQTVESKNCAATVRRDELAAMQKVDCVIVHSSVEAQLLHEVSPELRVTVVPWTITVRPTPFAFAERSGVAFVGGFGHPPNLDAVRYLTDDILPLMRKRVPECTTYLVGSKMPDEIRDLQRPGLMPLGFVSTLADILHKLRCTIVPLRYGAGIKGKVLESFAHGLPCVMSEVAAEGLELPDDLVWLLARTPEQFVEKVMRMHTDDAFNRQLAEAGLTYIERRYSAGVVNQALRAAVFSEERRRPGRADYNSSHLIAMLRDPAAEADVSLAAREQVGVT